MRHVTISLILVACICSGALADDAWQLTTAAGQDRYPSWSPDGSTIVYCSEDQPIGLYVISATGGAPRLLYSHPVEPYSCWWPDWSPDGTTIVFSAAVAQATPLAMFTVPASGGSATCLRALEDVYDWYPAWSPDGTQIAFSSHRIPESSHIWLIPSSGGAAANLTGDAQWESGPDWSPDGSQIVFASQRTDDSGNWGLWIIPATGGSPVALTNSTSNALWPAWSPNGAVIAYTGYSDSQQSDIWLISAVGGGPVRITDDAADDIDPCWSPDGAQIVFSSNRSGNWDLWIIDVDPYPIQVEGTTWGRVKAERR